MNKIHKILSIDESIYDRAYAAYENDKYDEFALAILSTTTARRVYSIALTASVLRFTLLEMSQSIETSEEDMKKQAKMYSLIYDIIPSLGKFRQQAAMLSALKEEDCSDESIVCLCEDFHKACAEFIADVQSFLMMLIGIYKMPQKRISLVDIKPPCDLIRSGIC